MKIQVISLAKSDYKDKKIGRWYILPEEFSKAGNKVKHDIKKDIWRFYFDYLTFNPDIVITVGLIGGVVGMLKKIGLIRKPLILDWNDYYTEISGKKFGIAKSAFLEYLAVSSADYIITPSKYLCSVCNNLGKKSIQIMHGVSEEFDSNEKIKLSKKLNLLYVGEQTRYKRVDEIIKAVNGLNCTLYLIGEKNEQFVKMAPSNVVFLGRLPKSEIVKYINSVDICLDTQDQDTSLKTMEYAYKGKAIIAPMGRKGYIFLHGENIFLTDNFRDAIAYFISNPKEIKKLEKNIKKIKVKKWKEVAKDYILNLNNIYKQ